MLVKALKVLMVFSLFLHVFSIGVQLILSRISVEQTSYDCPVVTRAALLCNLDSLLRMQLDPSFHTVEQYAI